MRIYLPSTLPRLAAAARAERVEPAPVVAYAVTPALRESYAEGDLEELEYAALTAAARQSLRMLADDPAAPRRRVVLAADVPDHATDPAGDLTSDPAAVRLAAAVPYDAVVSAHVDDDLALEDVAAAAEALPAAAAGDDDAAFTVDGAEAHELAWYAVQEIPDLLAV
ncbi:MAG: hypothetical protein GEV10_01300 [Streptosporangiales bacterium]|nr:hypothetical protein [Streptosporangiales bacterium]